MKLLSFICTMALAASGLASSLQESLVNVNNYWLQNPMALEAIGHEECTLNDNELISFHLRQVYNTLSARSPKGLSSIQARNREQSLKQLLAYAERELYPQNLTFLGRRPVFIDHRGVHCAVGYLIKQSGQPELSQKISEEMNYHYLADMSNNELNAWVEQSGFTLEELAWIQPGYPRYINFDNMKGGANGDVDVLIPDGIGSILVGGQFDTLGGSRHTYIGQWISGFAGYDWAALFGSGTNNRVEDILVYKNEVYVSGHFSQIDTIYTGSGVVKWNGTNWEEVGQFYIGALHNYVNDLEIYRDTLYAGGFFRSDTNPNQIFSNLAKWDGSEWIPVTNDTIIPRFFPGEVHALHVHEGMLYVGGYFQLPDSAQSRNIFALDGVKPHFLKEDLAGAVYDLESYDSLLYAGTQVQVAGIGDVGGLMEYDGSQWKQLLTGFAHPNSAAVYALETTPEGILFGGDFTSSGLIGWIIENVGIHRREYSSGQLQELTEAFGLLDSSVTSICYDNDMVYLGGRFTSFSTNSSIQSLGHVCSVYLPGIISTKEYNLQVNLDIYPNPTRSQVYVSSGEDINIEEVLLYSLDGKLVTVQSTLEHNQAVLYLENIPTGTYLVEINTDKGKATEKVLVR